MNPRNEEIPLSAFDLSLSEMRITNMDRILQVEKSMRVHGQLQAVVARVHAGGIQLIDGFKSYVHQMIMQREKPNNAINLYIISKSKALLFT